MSKKSIFKILIGLICGFFIGYSIKSFKTESIKKTEIISDHRQLSEIDANFKGKIKKTVQKSKLYWPERITANPGSPNVIVILMDDVGFSDLGCFGSEIKTPNIDKLAETGVRFNNFTTTALCSPSRASLLTGLNHHSAGMGWLSNADLGFPGYRGEIRKDVVTLPEVLRENGFNTMMVGKWHLTFVDNVSAAGPFDSWPEQRGFEHYWGFMDGETNQFNPNYLFSGNDVIEVPQDGSFYFPDAMTDKAIQMLKNQRAAAQDKPFFLYYSTPIAHAPHHTRPEDRAKYKGMYDKGWDAVQAKRLARQKEIGIAPENAKLASYFRGVEPWADMTPDEQKMAARLMENYAAFVDTLDQNIGRLLDYLEQVSERDNTMIILLSDNGGSKEVGAIGSTNTLKYFHGFEDTVEANLADYNKTGDVDTHPNYSHGWMQTSNTPFKMAKATTHGGGIRGPLIISWPAGIMEHNTIRGQFHHINDIMPTILETLDITHPEYYRGYKLKPMEGVSMAYAFKDGNAETRKTEQYYEMMGNRALISGSWKIVTYRELGEPYDSVPWELYNLAEDFSESDNLADKFPEKVAEMDAKWWAAAEKYNVLPIDGRDFVWRMYKSIDHFENHGRKKFVYYPDTDTIDKFRAPMLPNRSFTITAHIKDYQPGDSGVLVAQGEIDSGYALYIRDNRLHYDINAAGTKFTSLISDIKLPPGDITVSFKFDKINLAVGLAKGLMKKGKGFDPQSVLQGNGALYINNKSAGKAHFDLGIPLVIWEGLDIGLDRRLPASHKYTAPFAFTGKLEKVVYDIN